MSFANDRIVSSIPMGAPLCIIQVMSLHCGGYATNVTSLLTPGGVKHRGNYHMSLKSPHAMRLLHLILNAFLRTSTRNCFWVLGVSKLTTVSLWLLISALRTDISPTLRNQLLERDQVLNHNPYYSLLFISIGKKDVREGVMEDRW